MSNRIIITYFDVTLKTKRKLKDLPEFLIQKDNTLHEAQSEWSIGEDNEFQSFIKKHIKKIEYLVVNQEFNGDYYQYQEHNGKLQICRGDIVFNEYNFEEV